MDSSEAINNHKKLQTVLLVDDAKENIVVLSRLLRSQANIIFALSGEDALLKVNTHHPDLILMDISMPGMDGFEVLKRLKQSPVNAEIPVIFITGIPDTETEGQGLNLGAVDYITKPFAPAVVKARVRHQLKLQRLTLALKEANSRLTQLAMTDPLTGAYNRRYFLEQVSIEMSRIKRHFHPSSLLVMDIDKFKTINDNHGHDVGDKVIIEVVNICSASLRKNDVFGRIGGEEFALLLPDTPLDEANVIAKRLCAEIARSPVQTMAEEVFFTVSCGVAQLDPLDQHPKQVLKRADVALYLAKNAGRNQVKASNQK